MRSLVVWQTNFTCSTWNVYTHTHTHSLESDDCIRIENKNIHLICNKLHSKKNSSVWLPYTFVRFAVHPNRNVFLFRLGINFFFARLPCHPGWVTEWVCVWTFDSCWSCGSSSYAWCPPVLCDTYSFHIIYKFFFPLSLLGGLQSVNAVAVDDVLVFIFILYLIVCLCVPLCSIRGNDCVLKVTILFYFRMAHRHVDYYFKHSVDTFHVSWPYIWINKYIHIYIYCKKAVTSSGYIMIWNAEYEHERSKAMANSVAFTLAFCMDSNRQ